MCFEHTPADFFFPFFSSVFGFRLFPSHFWELTFTSDDVEAHAASCGMANIKDQEGGGTHLLLALVI